MFHLAIYNQHSPWQFPRGFSWGGSTNIPGEGHDVNLRSVWCSFFHSGRLKSVYFILKLESIFVDNMKSFNKIKWQLHWQKDKDKLSDQNSKAKLKTNLVDGETAVATVPLSTLKGGAFDNLVPFWWFWCHFAGNLQLGLAAAGAVGGVHPAWFWHSLLQNASLILQPIQILRDSASSVD